MLKPPDSIQWDTSQLALERQRYLEAGLSFEEIAARMLSSPHEIVGGRIEPYDTAPKQEKDGRQIIFTIRLDPTVSDLLYNARDGLRGRYWQSPDYGFLANRHFLNMLTPVLLSFARQRPPELIAKAKSMDAAAIEASLGGVSAKLWPREYNDRKTKYLLIDDHLDVRRWAERSDPSNPDKWRKSPECSDWEVKGALLGQDSTEYVPERKLERSCQIHRFGFT
ncbi:hypothetical protein [Bradyrhizobium sp. th.b2]|uniref:hypothetical protein n=1 Tax=Bradyrhizobium sp. th-b2 TaxID=172088 RepID=UPI00048F444D|nr:hypothetical protein [Bradyrhizobium sp. th.b2]